MQLVNAMVAIGGDQGNTVPKFGITVPELAVLRSIHGNDSVFDIAPAGESAKPVKHGVERQRLLAIFGRPTPEGSMRSEHVERLFPGIAARLPETLDELGIDESLFKPLQRASGGVKEKLDETDVDLSPPKAKSDQDDEPDDGEEDVDIHELSAAKLRKLAKARDIKVPRGAKAPDIVKLIEEANAALLDGEQDDGEPDDTFSGDGTGDIME